MMLSHVLEVLQPAWDLVTSTSRYQPEYFCLDQSDGLIWTMATGNAMLLLTHLVIPYTLLSRRIELIHAEQLDLLRLMPAMMIGLCGVEHLLMLFDLWRGWFWFEAIFKNLAGVQSVVTLVVFFNVAETDEMEAGDADTSKPGA